MTRRLILALTVACIVTTVACGDDSPTTPTPPPTPTGTRIIRLNGNLNFGDVPINTVRSDGILQIFNDGTANLTFTGLSAPCAGAGGAFSASPTSGTVAPGHVVNVSIRFAPTSVQDCSGNITVAGDQTSGTNTIRVDARGSLVGLPVFSRSGSGDTVFTIPSHVTRLRVDANTASSCQNFIARANGLSFVNIIMGTCSVSDSRGPFTGTYIVPAGATISIVSSTGINWTFTESR